MNGFCLGRLAAILFAIFAIVVLAALSAAAEPNQSVTPTPKPTREDVIAAMHSFDAANDSATATSRVDCSTLAGKVMAGYQGWFTCAGDSAELGWHHYQSHGEFRPGRCNIDFWPDVSELDADEKFATPFPHADGSVAYVFSSDQAKTILRHFQWMQQYGLDGVFVQRFVVETIPPLNLRHCNTVLNSCREGANRYGRCYAVMYDLSGVQAGGMQSAIDDWKLLVDKMRIGHDERDHAYLHHGGKPVVAVWGVGFNDHRAYTLADCDRFINFLKNDPIYGGNTVMVGVPTGWRTLDRDTTADPALTATLLKADIISPWTVGRYSTLEGVDKHAQHDIRPDIQWCRDHGKEYLPVVFPGFSWHNMNPKSPSDQIPRLKGEFLWRQYVDAKQAGATMIYQAMFDEMDEGTAIFKCTGDPPVGESKFLTFEGLPSDYYLWLVGMGGKLLRGEIPPSAYPPKQPETTPPSTRSKGNTSLGGD
ncbi:MAG TPA: glycoside hydrolase family 71/99-like protein [Pirellulales bacterium]|nr:glycoside hydrolase family 71/99-like protein [Pirellulales bacterium]